MQIPITASISISGHELKEKFIHSGGPGGQNVNKVATGVELRFDVRASASLSAEVKTRLEKLAGNRLTQNGVVIIVASRYRTQERNRADARDRLVELIAEAAKPLPPRRRATKPGKAVKKRRLDAKTKRGAIKKLRGGITGEE